MTTYKRKNPYYSLKIKRQVINRVLSGELNAPSATKEYGIKGHMTVYRWMENREKILGISHSKMQTKSSESASSSKEELLAELASIKQLLKYERLRSEAYLTMIKIAEEKFQIAIEKKSGAKRSNK